MVINYEAYLNDLIRALGYDPELFHGDEDAAYTDIIKAAEVLSRVRVAMLTSRPEQTRSIFITSISGERDETGFPDRIGVCIEFGSNVVATYERKDVYCHEGS
jgi:hypothetical protein